MAFDGSERFEVVGKLGEGGMGVVYEAIDHDRGMRVAIKALRNVDPVSLIRFKREFRAVTELAHPNIVHLYELVADGDDWFFTMELVPGDNLIDFVRAGRRPPATGPRPPLRPAPVDARVDDTDTTSQVEVPDSGPTGPEEADPRDQLPHIHTVVDLTRLRTSFGQLAEALHALHGAGMVHRDLKPSNVRVTPDRRVVLMDFGIVADSRQSQHGMSGAVGTPPYMAPEQAVGDPPTASADWYAFGVVLYLALTGRLPFRGSRRQILLAQQATEPPPPSQLVRGVPEDLDQLCARLLRRRAHRRPSGQEILRLLGRERGRDAALLDHTINPVFVGRRLELEALAAGFNATFGRRTVSFVVEGESGMGKSTLVRHFLDALEAATSAGTAPYILTARAHERESLSYKGFDGVVDDLASVLASLPEELLAAVAPDDAGLLLRLFPVLRRVRGLRHDRGASSLNPHDLRSRAVQALIGLIAGLSEIRPIVIFVDDLQWSGRDSLELVRRLLRDPPPQRLLFIAAVRSENIAGNDALRELLDELAGLGDNRQLALGPLSNDEQRELVAQMTGEASLLTPLGEQFWSQFGESPLFLVELLRYLDEAESMSESLRSLGLDDVLARRIDRLPAEPRAMLESIALADEPLPLSILTDAAGLAADDGDRAAAVLRIGHLARVAQADREPWLVCNHDRLREVLVRRIAVGDRRRLHRRLAEALEGWPNATLENLARHWLAAGELGEAISYLERAAAQATDKLAFDHAAELLQTAIDLDHAHSGADAHEARLPMQRRLGDALVLAGRCFEAAQLYERAAAHATGDEALDLERRAADNLLRTGHLVEGVDKLTGVLEALGAKVARSRSGAAFSFLMRRAHLILRGLGYERREESEIPVRELGRLDAMYAASSTLGMIDHLRGAALQTRHIRTALQVGEERRVLRALAIEIAYLTAMGGRKLARGQELGVRVLQRARELDDSFLIGATLMALGGGQFFSGQPRAAIEALREGEMLLTDIAEGAEWERVTTRYFLTLAQIAAGDFEAVADTTYRSLVLAEQRNDLYARTYFVCIPRTIVLLRDDKPSEAERELDTALDGWPETPRYIGHYIEAYARVLVRLYRGDGEGATDELVRTRSLMREVSLDRMPWVSGEVAALDARAALLVGDDARARQSARALSRIGLDYTSAIADTIEAALAHRGGDSDIARERLERARAQFVALGAEHLVAACSARLADASADYATTWADAQSVVNPARMWDLLLPM